MVKNPPANTGDTDSIPGSGRYPGVKIAPHFSILAWKIPRTEDLVGYSPWGRKELDMTELLSTHTSVTLTMFQMLKSHIRPVPAYHIGRHRYRTSQVASVVSDSFRPCGL